jgi:hypothetical protein
MPIETPAGTLEVENAKFRAGTITATLSGVASSITNQANSATITASASAGNNTIEYLYNNITCHFD